MTCADCGRSFTPKRRHARFCSGKCRARASVESRIRARIESALRLGGERSQAGPEQEAEGSWNAT